MSGSRRSKRPYLSEKWLEKELTREVERRGGLSIKLLSTASGLPDRLILMPGGLAAFAEIKSTGKKPEPLQCWWHNRLKKLGFVVFIIDGKETLINAIRNLWNLQDSCQEDTSSLP